MKPLSRAEIERYYTQLLRLSVELQKQIGAMESGAQQSDVDAVGAPAPLDSNETPRATPADLEHAKERLRNVRSSLGMMRDGQYGMCRRCSGQIERERLDVVPEAVDCQACAIAFERRKR